MTRYLGFDTAYYQGDKIMSAWKQHSPYGFTGYYLKAPCHGDASYMGTRERLAAMGWGFLIIYVGRQVEGPCSSRPVSAALGSLHGRDAIAKTAAEGFPDGSVIFLDVERIERIPAAMKDYVRAWFAEVNASPFAGGIYCHVKNAVDLRETILPGHPAAKPDPVFWVAGGRRFNPASSVPADSGVPFARIWQGRLDTRETYAGYKVNIDINVADMPDPSGVHIATSPRPEEPESPKAGRRPSPSS
ncbi:MAG: DUF1906 domain-containing protein [Bryobacteraceae bacterium]